MQLLARPEAPVFAYLELAHDWRDLLLERLVRDLTTPQVDLVPDEYDGDLCVSHVREP